MTIRGVILVKCILVALGGCSTSAEDQVLQIDHRSSIAQIAVAEGTDRRIDLNRCINAWESLSDLVLKSHQLESAIEHGDDFLLLEIGNSGFPRYDYFLFHDRTFESSMPLENIESAELQEKLDMIDLDDLRGDAESSTDDGDCYFLSLRKNGELDTVAIYGEIGSSAAGSIVEFILSRVR